MASFIDDDLEINSNNNGHIETSGNSVNALLPLDDDRVKVHDENGEEIRELTTDEDVVDPAKIVTKHDFVSSPWTKLGIVGGFFALGFGIVYLSINSLMGGNSETAAKPEAIPTATPTPIEAQKDGDAYAKLALQKQQSDLQNLNGKEETTNEATQLTDDKNENKNKTSTTIAETKPTAKLTTKPTTTTVTKKPKPAPQKVQSTRPTPAPSSAQARRTTIARVPSQRPSRTIASTIPKVTIPRDTNSNRTSVASAPNRSTNQTPSDPLAEIERLRNLTSMGRVNYNKELDDTTVANNDTNTSGVSPETIESRNRRNGDTATTDEQSENNQDRNTTNTNNGEIQQLTPRWEPNAGKTVEFSAQNKQLMNVNFSQEESQILEERAPQYLVIGSSTKATLVTPLLIAQDKPNKNLRFVAQLNEPIKSNTGEIAIPTGTQVAIVTNAVDGGFGMDAEVVAILKDGTEYPIAPGTITVLASKGDPLIARPYKGKGGEIARYDITLGAIAGLAKIGEIINQPDSTTTQNLPLGGTVSTTSGTQRNISGAFLEGAFTALGSSVGKRTNTAVTEVTARPNVWYVPANTKVTLRVNRSIKL